MASGESPYHEICAGVGRPGAFVRRQTAPDDWAGMTGKAAGSNCGSLFLRISLTANVLVSLTLFPKSVGLSVQTEFAAFVNFLSLEFLYVTSYNLHTYLPTSSCSLDVGFRLACCCTLCCCSSDEC